MELIERIDLFKRELLLIKDDNIRRLVEVCLCNAPDYIFVDCPSSTSGKYHPIDEISADGTILHTKRVVAIAYELSRGLDISDKSDIVVAAAILHDMVKQGFESGGHTVKDHPQLMADLLLKVYIDGFKDLISEESISQIYWAIAHHYGPWSLKRTKKPMDEYTLVELSVYLADYICSRRYVKVDYNNRED